MRDFFVMALFIGAIPFAIKRPVYGILLWCWISYMNPHRLCWGFAFDFPFAFVTAVIVLISIVNSKEKFRFPASDPSVVLLICFCILMTISTFNSFYPEYAWVQFTKVAKIQFMIFISLLVLTDHKDLKMLVWIIVASLAFYGVKGGVFTINTAGIHRVRGPEDSFIEGNNEIGLAMLMIIPLLRYLMIIEKRKIIYIGLHIAMWLSLLAVVGTHSRGALIGGVLMLSMLIIKSKKPIFLGLLTVFVCYSAITFMPDEWRERMNTIETYEEDKSAMGRINAWSMGFNMAKDNPLTGGGFEAFNNRESFITYAPDPTNAHDAHSIYFEVMGEHGFLGLAMFIAIWIATWWSARSNIIITKNSPPGTKLFELNQLNRHVQVALIAYLSGGAFLGLAYFDLTYHLMCLVVISKVIVNQEISKERNDETNEAKGELAPVSQCYYN